MNLEKLSAAESRIDQVFDQAFSANDAPMLDWVEIKFALKDIARMHKGYQDLIDQHKLRFEKLYGGELCGWALTMIEEASGIKS